MTTDVTTLPVDGEVVAGTGGALALHAGQTEWTEEQEAALVQLGLAEAPDADRLVFLHVAQRVGLDPFARQIYMIGRDDQGGKKWTIQTGIDGFRVIAERNPQYAGQTPVQWCGEDGQWTDVWLSKKSPSAARVGIIRHDRAEPIYATCLFDEFAQTKRDGQLNTMWKTKGAHMIGKCAEAGALRKAFPQDMAGLVTDDEAAGFTRAAARTTVRSERADAGPLDVGELTGQPAKPEPAKKTRPSTEPRKAELAGGADRMTPAHQKRLFEAIRKAEGLVERGGSKEWAGEVLGKTVRSWAPLTCDDANLLTAKLEAGDLTTGQEAEAVDETPAAADTGDDVEDAYAQIEAERDAAQGQLGDESGGGS